MSTLKDLSRRMKSIRSTQKITGAMKMVAASKLRRSQTALENFRPYYQEMNEMVNAFFSEDEGEGLSAFSQILLKGGKGPPLFLVIGTDKGLCGGYNSNIVKTFYNQRVGITDYRLMVLGHKSQTLLKNVEKNLVLNFPSEKDNRSFSELATELKAWLEQGVIGSVKVISYTFKNLLQQSPYSLQLVPLTIPKPSQAYRPFLTEPKKSLLGSQLLEDWFTIQLQKNFLESTVCEQAARMIAMEGATRNAGEVLQKLQTTYNRTRQAQITSQLIEIISAAQAL